MSGGGTNNNNSNNGSNDNVNNKSNNNNSFSSSFFTSDVIQAVSSCLAYSLASNSMVLVNRFLVSPKFFGFEEKTFVIFIQALMAVILLEIAKSRSIISYDKFNLKSAQRWSPVTIFFVLMLYTSTQATAGLPIHLIVVFKNLTNIGIVFGEWYLFNEPTSMLVIASLMVILFGALMAAKEDIYKAESSSGTTRDSTDYGYFWMLMNCLCTAGYVLYMRYATSKCSSLRLSKFGMALYNNLISMILLFPMMSTSGDILTVWSSPLLVNTKFIFFLIFSGVLGVALNLASFWCVSVNNATTYATVGALKELPTPFIGVFFLHETLDPSTALYVSFGLLGGILYGYAKYKQKIQQQQKQQKKVENNEETKSLLKTNNDESNENNNNNQQQQEGEASSSSLSKKFQQLISSSSATNQQLTSRKIKGNEDEGEGIEAV